MNQTWFLSHSPRYYLPGAYNVLATRVVTGDTTATRIVRETGSDDFIRACDRCTASDRDVHSKGKSLDAMSIFDNRTR